MNVVWTPANLAKLERLRQAGEKWQTIADRMGTTIGAVKSAHITHIRGRVQEPRERRDYNREWARKNAERVNAERRKKRADAKAALLSE